MVKPKNNLSGFTIVEFIISLIITIVIVLIAFFILNRAHVFAGLNIANTKGVFACYWDECNFNNDHCKLKQTIYEGKTLIEDKDVTSEGYCSFGYAKRLNRVFVVATGAGSAKNSAQVKTDYAPYIFEKIIPGKANSSFEDGKTILSNMVVLPGQTSNNGLRYENIFSCEIIKAPATCRKVAADSNLNLEQDAKPVGCEVVASKEKDVNSNDIIKDAYVKIIGCDSFADTNYKDLIKLDDLVRSNGFLDRLDINNLASLSKSQTNNIYEYNYKNASGNNEKYEFNFRLKDYSYDSRVNNSKYGYSHMEEILTNTTIERQNELIKKVMNLKPGAPNKNGAVVIVW